MNRILRAVTLLAVLSVTGLLPGCLDDPPPAPIPQTTPGTTQSPDGWHQVTGTAISKDDTGLPDRPMPDTDLILVPGPATDTVWAAAGLTPGTDDEHHLAWLYAELDQATLDQVVHARTDTRGRFTLTVPAGEHLLCRAHHTDQTPDQPPSTRWWVTGCDRVTVTGPATWQVSHGEAGVNATTTTD